VLKAVFSGVFLSLCDLQALRQKVK
jgi:hypothetical protein